MIADAHLVLPPSLHDAKNRSYLAHAYHHEANRSFVKAQRRRDLAEAARGTNIDNIVVAHERKADIAEKNAESFFQAAKRLEAEIQQGRTLYQKLKTPVTNGLIATAVAAEIISIPILVANCAVVGRHAKHPKAALLDAAAA